MRKLFILAFIGMHLAAMLSVQGSHCHGDACGGEVHSAMLDAHGHDHEHDHDDDASKVADKGDMDSKEPSKFHGWHSHSGDSAVAQLAVLGQEIHRQAANVSYSPPITSSSIEPLLEPPSIA